MVKNKKQEKNKIYNVTRHKRAIIIWISIVFLVCLGVIPYVINGIYKLLILGGWLDKEVIPGYLSGLMGIIIGFFIEGTLIEQYRQLNKYQSMLKSLEHILDQMKKTCLECTKNTKLCEVNSFVFQDIISSVNYDSIFLNLPGYFIRVSKKNKGNIHKLLHDINSKISAINRAKEYDESLYKELFESINMFQAKTKQGKEGIEVKWEDAKKA